MQRPSTPDYYRDLGVEQTATPEEIQNALRTLENKNGADGKDGPQKIQRGSALADSISQARTAYGVLRQPSERAKYDTNYANVRAAWFRYRKWTEWQKGDDTTVVGEDVSPSNRLIGYSRKFMSKMNERRAQRSTVFVSGTPRSGRQEEFLDAAEEELGEENGPQARSKASHATDPATEFDTTEPEAKSSGETVLRPRERYADSHPQKQLCPKAGHHWQGWWPAMEAFVPPGCPRCQLFASSFYCSNCNATVCLACRLT